MRETESYGPSVLGAMWRRRNVVVAIIVASLILAIVGTLVADGAFRATALMSVEDPRATSIIDQGQAQRPERYVADQAQIIQSELVLLRSVDALPDDLNLQISDLQKLLVVESSDDSNLIQLVVEADDGPTAVQIVNTVAEQYQDVLALEKAERIQSAIAQLETSIDTASSDLRNIQSEIVEIVSARDGRDDLDAQFEANLQRFSELQAQLSTPGTSVEAAARARTQIEGLLAQFTTMQAVLDLESSDPELAALLSEQSAIIERQSGLVATRDGLRADAELSTSGVTLFAPAQIAELVQVGRIGLLALGLILGTIIAAMVAYILDLRYRAFADRTEPESILGAPLLADIPDFGADGIETDAPVAEAPESATSEAFGFAAASIERRFASRGDDGGGNIVVVTGPVAGSGRTTTVLNIGLAAAKRGKRVLLVDADVSNPELSKLLLGFDTIGSLTVERTRRSGTHVRIRVAGTALDILTNGMSAVPAQGTARELAVEDLLGKIPDDYYDLVLIDTPPLAQASYVASIIGSADHTLLTLRHGTRVAPVEEAADRLEALGTRSSGYLYMGTGSRRRTSARDDDPTPELTVEDIVEVEPGIEGR